MASSDNTKKLIPHQGYGKRIRLAITVSGLKFPAFSQKYRLPLPTLYALEKEKVRLTDQMAERIITALALEGYVCTRNWLITGKGLIPYSLPMDTHAFHEDISFLLEEAKILREIDCFKTLHPSGIVFSVADDGMEPYYSEGDFVGGLVLRKADILKALNKNCIVTLQNGTQMIRRLLKGSKNLFTLGTFNPNTTVSVPVLYHQHLESATPIIWHRRLSIV